MAEKRAFLLALVCMLASCSVISLKPEAAHVEITAVPVKSNTCQYMGEVIGSEGHWYTFLFIANRTLMQAAVDDLRNQAAAKGADTVFIDEPHFFTSSVTLLGLAYRCRNRSPGK